MTNGEPLHTVCKLWSVCISVGLRVITVSMERLQPEPVITSTRYFPRGRCSAVIRVSELVIYQTVSARVLVRVSISITR